MHTASIDPLIKQVGGLILNDITIYHMYSKETHQILGKSLSSLHCSIKVPNDPIPSYKRGKLLYFCEDKQPEWIKNGRKDSVAPSLTQTEVAMIAEMKRRPVNVIIFKPMERYHPKANYL